MSKIRRSSYSASEKLKILKYAKNHGQREAARHFSIDHSMISRWKNREDKLKSAKGESRRIGAGRKANYPEAEASLKNWLIELQNDGIAVTSKVAKFYMKEVLIGEFAQVYPDGENFLASERWLYGFIRRNGFSLRRKGQNDMMKAVHESVMQDELGSGS